MNKQKALLRQRLIDMANGAYGGYEPLEYDGEYFSGMANEMGLDAFGRWVGAIQNTFGSGELQLVKPTMLEYFDTLDSAVDHLWNNGVRP